MPSRRAAITAWTFAKSQKVKRVGLVFRPTRVASFDHRKLGGGS